MKRTLRTVALVLACGLLLAAGYVRLPYYAIGPGPAREVGPLIDVRGHERYPSSGKLIMTTVRWYQVTALLAAVAWADPHQSIVGRDVLYPPGSDAATERQRARSQMDESKIDAAYVVLAALEDYPGRHGRGALIQVTVPGCPSDGKLFSGDTIVAIDQHPVGSAKDASRLISAARPGVPLDFQVRAAGETHDVAVARGVCPGTEEPLVGVRLVDAFPFQVEIASGDVGGPSAGLMFALGLYDQLTPSDLTQGRTIAGTGTIDPQGGVGPIGGIEDKVLAAERVGATVFLVPKDNMAELQSIDTGAMRLVSVATFQDAVDALSAPA